MQGCISTDRAIDISSILSIESRRAVLTFCASAANRNGTAATSWHKDLLTRLFSHSYFVESSRADSNPSETKSEFSTACDDPSNDLFSRHPIWSWISARIDSAGDQNVKSSAPTGSWLSMASLYVSSLETVQSMAYFWLECVDEIRVHWENKVPIPRLVPPIPTVDDFEKSNSAPVSVLGGASSNRVWMEPLWEDQVMNFSRSATPFQLPDLKQNLPYQKLQMLNICIICSEVSQTVNESYVEQCVQNGRKQLISQLEQLESRKMEYNDDNITKNKTLQDLLDLSISHRDLSHINTPRLQRRLPMTSDSLAQRRHLANKFRKGSSRSANENSMLKWQILYPELVSDIRAFKGCNKTLSKEDGSSVDENEIVTFADFIAWYGGAGVALPVTNSSSGDNETYMRHGLDDMSLEDLQVGNIPQFACSFVNEY